jgi:crotonobetainyl-CoA:carnitine CoA-transferase CaiB-like acyl-CoA transferase
MPLVLDLSRGIAGRFCARMLALGGMRVVRAALPGEEAEEIRALRAAGYPIDILDHGKQAVALDPAPETRAGQLRELITGAAAVVEDGGPDGLASFGLAEEQVRAWAPRCVLTRISEFGQDGPRAGWQGSELVNLAAGGLLFLTGTCDRPPVQLAPFQAQLTSGLMAAIATMAALYGEGGATVDISKQEAVASLITPALTEYAYTGVVPAREGTVAGMTRVERSRDGWVYAGPSAPALADYKTLAAFLEIPELAEERFSTPEQRMAHWAEHQALIVPKLQERTTEEWTDAAESWRLTFGRVQTTRDLLDCEILAERGFIGEIPVEDGAVRAPLAPYLADGARPGAPDA